MTQPKVPKPATRRSTGLIEREGTGWSPGSAVLNISPLPLEEGGKVLSMEDSMAEVTKGLENLQEAITACQQASTSSLPPAPLKPPRRGVPWKASSLLSTKSAINFSSRR